MNAIDVNVKSVRKVFYGSAGEEPYVALDNCDLRIESAEFVSILGPSGCGKTTLLKLVDGLLAADAGRIVVGGEDVDGPSPDRAMVFQHFALLPWTSVRNNVEFPLRARNIKPAEARKLSQEHLELVGLSGFEDFMPGQLSGGMQQRVGLARALAVQPSLLLLDEPFGALDALTREFLQDDLLRIWERSRLTVMFVTHSIEEAVYLSDRVAMMESRPGRVSEIVDVALPRPRDESVRSSVSYLDTASYLRGRLRSIMGGDSLRVGK